MHFRYFLTALLLSLSLAGCDNGSGRAEVDYKTLPTLTDQGINIVVEIPAGTNHKIEYQKEEGTFVNDQRNGHDRVIQFLPYPGNYGFIPSTLMDPERGGDGDALDVLLLSESLKTGTVVDAVPIAAIRLKDAGVLDTKIVAVPVDTSLRIIDAVNFRDFLVLYDPAKRIIEEWFLSYDPGDATELLGWEDEQYAMDEIRRWITH